MILLDDGTLAYSASDLSAAAGCEFAVLRSLDALLGRVPAVAVEQDAMLERVARLGTEHEQRVLRRYVAAYGPWTPGRAGGVAQVARQGRPDRRADLEAAHAGTLALLGAGAARPDVVYQAGFFDGRFVGRADFLVRDGDTWAVHDTKLARNAAVVALLQVAAYADQLTAAGLEVDARVHLHLGDDAVTEHRLVDLVPVYRLRRARLEAVLDEHRAEAPAVAWGDERYRACGRCAVCAPEAAAARDLLLVAGVYASHRERLRAAGLTSIDALAVATGPVPGMGAGVLAKLRLQARLQVAQERHAAAPDEPGTAVTFEATGVPAGAAGAAGAAGTAGTAEVTFENGIAVALVDPGRIAATLPPPDEGDIYFDFEGDPLWLDPASQPADPAAWGLEYLFGIIEQPPDEETEPAFVAFQAHDRAEEGQALRDFLAYLADRRARHPGMHVYHYAAYERSTLQRLAGRHGVGEDEVDQLLRDGVLVDLYASVRAGLRTGQPSYSLKQVERLYLPASRAGEVTNAADSIVEYAEAVAARVAGRQDEWIRRIEAILAYNRVDCVSTKGLRDWLVAHVEAAGHAPSRAAVLVEQTGDDVAAQAPDTLEADLLAFAGPGPQVGVTRESDRQAVALLAAALRYHTREDKPFWWAHFDRLIKDPADWTDRGGVLVADEVAVDIDWQPPLGRRASRRVLAMTGQLEQGSDLRAGAKAMLLYDPPLPPGAVTSNDGVRGWRSQGTVLDVSVERGVDHPRDVLRVEEALGRHEAAFDEVPMGLVPAPGPSTKPLEAGIRRLAERVAAALPTVPDGAAMDLARRRPPRTRSGAPLPRPSGPRDVASALVAALRDLDDSYLAVQGPPGSGKTYTGARVIADLVASGWRVGVVAQSHAGVENLLTCVAAAGVPAADIGKAPGQGPAPDAGTPWTWLSDSGAEQAFLTGHATHAGGFVLGGTAWTFANPSHLPAEPLDLLVVDEAGQFALANTFAVAGAARNLLLLGDPQQLPQVSQGTHPEPVDRSALGWLSDGHDTLPDHLGYFLAATWRLHPALCSVVSRLSYDGRLRPTPAAAARTLEGIEPGVHGVLVEHRGNGKASPEEGRDVVRLVADLVGRRWCDPAAPTPDRPLTPDDVLVVAAYNAQVGVVARALRKAGIDGVRVGTVDKFQGQQAAVVIVTMATSSPGEARRGMDFLLNRNRLNVAISRGQWAAFVVRSPALTDYLPSRPDRLAELGAFLGLTSA